MSVLVKGMKMPKGGMTLKVVADENGTYIFETRSGRGYFVYEVPPHGRLIDADALETDTEYDLYLGDFTSYTKEQIDLAPTVIEAEGDER